MDTTTLLVSLLTFCIGILIGMFYKYGEITQLKTQFKTQIGDVSFQTMQAEISALRTEIAMLHQSITAMGITDVAANVKTMQASILFTPSFQREIATICSEHDGMRNEINVNSNRLTALESVFK